MYDAAIIGTRTAGLSAAINLRSQNSALFIHMLSQQAFSWQRPLPLFMFWRMP